jgi:hypothetical protein
MFAPSANLSMFLLSTSNAQKKHVPMNKFSDYRRLYRHPASASVEREKFLADTKVLRVAEEFMTI